MEEQRDGLSREGDENLESKIDHGSVRRDES